MSSEFDRPSTQHMVITIASIVLAIAVVIGVSAVLLGTLLTPHTAVSASNALSATVPSPKASVATLSASDPTATAASQMASAPSAAQVAPPAAPTTDAGIRGTVVIDAGHQGTEDMRPEPIGPGSSQTKPRVQSGAEGVVTHAPESQINLEVALKLRKALEAQGVKVVMVRTTQNVDIPNSQRAKLANDNNAALFIRLHCDGVDSPSVHGFLMLRPGKNQWTGPIVAPSKIAADFVDRAALAATGAYDRGTQARTDQTGFNWSKVPSIIVEMGVMSNPTEDRKLSTASYQQKLADGMTNGVVEYLKSR